MLISLSTSIAVGFRALEALRQVIADGGIAIKSKSQESRVVGREIFNFLFSIWAGGG